MKKFKWKMQKPMFFLNGRYKVTIARGNSGMDDSGDFYYQYAIFNTANKFHEADYVSVVSAMNRTNLKKKLRQAVIKHRRKGI